MTEEYIVKYYLGKLPYGKIRLSEINVEANSEKQAREVAEIQLKYGQNIKGNIHIVTVDKQSKT